MNIIHIIFPNFSKEVNIQQLKYLARALGIAEERNNGLTSHQQLFALFGYKNLQDLPIASLTASLDGLEDGVWLRADPVTLQVDWSNVFMGGNEQVELCEEEVLEIAAKINELFIQDNLFLHTPRTKRWYVKLNSSVSLHSRNPAEVVGKSLHHVLPTGSDAAAWIKRMNDVQMLLCHHPKINGLWFWGEGTLLKNACHDLQIVFSKKSMATQLASLYQVDHYPLDKDSIMKLYDSTNPAHQSLIYLEHDEPCEIEIIDDLCKNYFSSSSLRKKFQLMFHCNDGRQFNLANVKSKWRWW